jgi:transposase
LDETDQHHCTLAPRCLKDEIEEALFAKRRDLFSDLSVVFLDTTSLSFEGEGGATLGARGHSKDHRPDLKQMILGVVIDAKGRPVCTEMWPGNTADVNALLPILDRLRGRFGITRVCVVADRGFISAATLTGLEERGLEYILGARERTDALVRRVVLEDEGAFVPLFIDRDAGKTQLFVKEVKVAGKRYIVCRNEAEAEKDRTERQAIVAGLAQQLARGDKALIGNSAYRRYLRKTASGRAFTIDAGKLADEARFDGLFVLRTNARISPLQAVLRYRDLLQVEDLFRRAKAVLATRPIFHSSDAAIRGHVFCSFLALVLQKELDDRCRKAGLKPEWREVLRDLDRLQEATLESGGKTWIVRTEAGGWVPPMMKMAGIALPPRVRATSPPAAAPPASPKRRGRPRRSATHA